MTDKPLSVDDQLPEAEAEERFKRMVSNLVGAPHKPHKQRKSETPAKGPQED